MNRDSISGKGHLPPPRNRETRPVTPIKLTRGQAVRVQCPRPDKYPSFARSFGGRKGTVLVIEPFGAPDVIVVDVSTRAEPGQYINVVRSWLSHDRRVS